MISPSAWWRPSPPTCRAAPHPTPLPYRSATDPPAPGTAGVPHRPVQPVCRTAWWELGRSIVAEVSATPYGGSPVSWRRRTSPTVTVVGESHEHPAAGTVCCDGRPGHRRRRRVWSVRRAPASSVAAAEHRRCSVRTVVPADGGALRPRSRRVLRPYRLGCHRQLAASHVHETRVRGLAGVRSPATARRPQPWFATCQFRMETGDGTSRSDLSVAVDVYESDEWAHRRFSDWV